MKVLHVVSRFYPDQGGSEKFVGGLIEGLGALGVTAGVVSFGESPAELVWRGVPVHRLRWSPFSESGVEAYMCFGDPEIAAVFGAVLDRERPDAVHVHTRTREVALELVREGPARGIPTVFTYHHPAATCLRGDLMRWNREACDGTLDTRRCTACQLHDKGIPQPAAVAVAALPALATSAASLCSGRWRTGLLTARRTRILHDQVRKFLGEFAHCIALCSWSRDLLVSNGVAADRVSVIRPGVAEGVRAETSRGPGSTAANAATPVRLIYVGRFHPAKGVHVVIEALRGTSLPVRLDVHGVRADSGSDGYVDKLHRIAAGDPRIRVAGPLASDRVVEELRTHDALVVPSLMLETGPLVVYEAFAAGIPVIASDLGAINEVVEDGVSGRLIPAGDVGAWRRGLTEIGQRPQDLSRIREGIPALRTIRDVAKETLRVYAGVGAGRPPGLAAAPETTRR